VLGFDLGRPKRLVQHRWQVLAISDSSLCVDLPGRPRFRNRPVVGRLGVAYGG
jgi:hypothetical protein